ncbi:MAG: hypothetical protein EOP48_00945 [Sphingobacteriales bacterium]|nr:MAG: hypothetical protein EOP48_00945 [Sphingobacteriales bacterium]
MVESKYKKTTTPVQPTDKGTADGTSDIKMGRVIEEIQAKLDLANAMVDCAGAKSISFEKNILKLDPKNFKSEIVPTSSNPNIEVLCKIKGTVKVPTNHILNVNIATEDLPVYTEAFIDSGETALLTYDILHNIAGQPFGNRFQAELRGTRIGPQDNVFKRVPSYDKLMACDSVKKVESEDKFEINLIVSISTDDTVVDIDETWVQIFGTQKFTFELVDCAK